MYVCTRVHTVYMNVCHVLYLIVKYVYGTHMLKSVMCDVTCDLKTTPRQHFFRLPHRPFPLPSTWPNLWSRPPLLMPFFSCNI